MNRLRDLVGKVRKEWSSERSLVRRLLYHPLRPSRETLRIIPYMGARFCTLVNEDLGWRLVSQTRYEEAEIEALTSFIEPADVCLDVGANIGIYTVLMAQAAHRGEVLAFEPLNLHRSLLMFNVTLNGVNNVTVHECAVSREAGEAELVVPQDGGYASLRATGRKAVKERVSVATRSLDDLLTNDPRKVGALKVDVEGAELLVLEGAIGLFGNETQRPRVVLLEMSDSNQTAFGTGHERILSFMDEHQYCPFSLTKAGELKEGFDTTFTENVLFFEDGTRPGRNVERHRSVSTTRMGDT